MKTFNNRPIFLLNVDDDSATITTISLVDDPAMELPMFCFGKETVHYSMQDEMKHNIISCIVRTDYPILRMTAEGNPYYVVFNKETSEKLCQKLMRDGYQQNISLDHNGELIEGIQLQEVFLKDTSKGISPVGFEDAADGSLFGVYHITDDQLWQDCLDGKFGGVSLESYFQLQEFNKIKNKKSMANKIKEALKKLLMEFNNLSTDKAELYWEEDSELNVGYKVFVDDAEGNRVPAEDGEYISDENVIKVEGGIVTEIEKKDPADSEEEQAAEETQEEVKAEEEAPAEPEAPAQEEEPAQEEPKTDEKDEKISELEGRIAELETKVEELVSKIAEIASAPAAQPVVDEFDQVTKKTSTGDKKLDKRIALAAALKQN